MLLTSPSNMTKQAIQLWQAAAAWQPWLIAVRLIWCIHEKNANCNISWIIPFADAEPTVDSSCLLIMCNKLCRFSGTMHAFASNA